MYSYAQTALSEYGNLPNILAARFPIVFIDEMQDTQKVQDDILNQVFSSPNAMTVIQRFGDPDQAIFHGIGSEEPNQTFNRKSLEEMSFVIHKSHRFDNTIADKIKCMSYNRVPLASELDDVALLKRRAMNRSGDGFEHTILIFDDATRVNVVDQFAEIVSGQFDISCRRSLGFRAKVLGAVGNEIDPSSEQLKIGHYWVPYDKNSVDGNPIPNSLIEGVRYCRRNSSVDWIENYKLLLACLLRLLRLAGVHDGDGRYFSARSLRARLEPDGSWRKLREAIFVMLDDSYQLDEESWNLSVKLLTKIFAMIVVPEEAREYLAFALEKHTTTPSHETGSDSSLSVMPGNRAVHKDGFSIEFSTIHGVKGETHDATLVVETKNYCFDFGVMLSYLTGDRPTDAEPNEGLGEFARSRKTNKQFMRQLYVAMSRPKHLLCLAIHSDRISFDDARRLQDRGWRVNRLASSRSMTSATDSEKCNVWTV